MLFFDLVKSVHDWNAPASVHEFGHALGAAFEANLAYSIVIRLGNFSGATLISWVYSERMRVIPAMSETPTFDESKFTSRLLHVRDGYLVAIRTLNRFF